MLYNPASVQGRVNVESLSGFDAERRAREVAVYRQAPDVRMPVVVAVSERKGQVKWPRLFQ
jgi:anti-sigma factor RsiW